MVPLGAGAPQGTRGEWTRMDSVETAILVGVVAVLIIAVTSRVGPKWGVAAPLLLVLIGIGVSFLPFVPEIEVEPEIILAVVLPPLLFSSAVNMPAMNFRREFNAIGSLAVALVVVSAVLLGFFFHWIFPELALPWCIALGAILSPTDAVAVSIAKNVGISSRVTTILEGESLLNDATALVLLRTAVAAAAASFSVWHAVGQFAYAVAVACVIGFIAGKLGVFARARSGDATVSSVISFVVPFVASVPTDLAGGSGLVAAVVAGIITGRKKDRVFSADQRLSDRTMWRAVTLVLEGAVFLIMGLEVKSLLHEHTEMAEGSGAMGSLGVILLVAVVALLLMTLIRAAYVLPLTAALGRRAARMQALQPRMEAMESAVSDRDMRRTHEIITRDASTTARLQKKLKKKAHALDERRGLLRTEEEVAAKAESRWQRLENRTRRALSDIDYLVRQPLTWRDGTVMVAAGMRGAVTLAAAQTLPHETPFRSSLVLIAFVVAVLSLLVQGGLLAPLVRAVKPSVPDEAELARQREAVTARLADVIVEEIEGESQAEHKLRSIVARRDALLELSDEGYYEPECTAGLLASFDASELGLRLKLEQMTQGNGGREVDLATAEEAELEAMASSEATEYPAPRVVERFSLATPGPSPEGGKEPEDEA